MSHISFLTSLGTTLHALTSFKVLGNDLQSIIPLVSTFSQNLHFIYAFWLSGTQCFHGTSIFNPLLVSRGLLPPLEQTFWVCCHCYCVSSHFKMTGTFEALLWQSPTHREHRTTQECPKTPQHPSTLLEIQNWDKTKLQYLSGCKSHLAN